MPITFRGFFNDPGEPLLATVTPHEAAVRLASFLSISGLTDAAVVTSNTATTPLPLYPAEWPRGRRRWAGLNPTIMWHPLFWLPDRLASRMMLDVNGDIQVETDEVWAARVFIELTAAGMYREQDGQWVDVLALQGLDSDDPGVQTRIARWVAGADDEQLDAIDLSSRLAVEPDESWSLAAAWDAVQTLRPIAWYVSATSLRDDVDDAMTVSSQVSDEVLASSVRTIAILARYCFADMEGEDEFWRNLYDSWDGRPETLIGDCLPAMAARLDEVRDQLEGEVSDIGIAGGDLTDVIGASVQSLSEDDDAWAALQWGKTPTSAC